MGKKFWNTRVLNGTFFLRRETERNGCGVYIKKLKYEFSLDFLNIPYSKFGTNIKSSSLGSHEIFQGHILLKNIVILKKAINWFPFILTLMPC